MKSYNFYIKKIKNYGYPISSYGEHYGYPSPGVNYKYEEAPLYKSHEKFGFIVEKIIQNGYGTTLDRYDMVLKTISEN